MKKLIKPVAAVTALYLFLIIFVVFAFMYASGALDDGSGMPGDYDLLLLFSEEVLAYLPLVQQYCEIYGIEDYVIYILAIMQVESGGLVPDVMQSSESLGLPPNSLGPEASINQGCKYFSELVASADASNCDIETIIQAYNYGGGFVSYVAQRGGQYTFNLAMAFSSERFGGVKVTYTNPIAVAENGGWRYNYGNMFYVRLVSQYLPSGQAGTALYQAVMMEALKYQGWTYVFGGASPSTSFDCSGLIQWCYAKAGVSLPRTAQQQYDATVHIPLTLAQPGDLVFFQGTYSTVDYITHIGIYVGNNQMYHAGNPIGYADLTTSYWQSHIVGAGRVTG